MLEPAAYPAEAALHNLVQEAPQMLPLAGSPRLTVLGREVRLGTGSADLLAVESTGRLVVIEVKLAENAESRRAVVAQVLSYAGYLQGLDPEQLESRILGRHLEAGGSVLAAVQAAGHEDAVDPEEFREGLVRSLADGSFRLVIVLDSAPMSWCRWSDTCSLSPTRSTSTWSRWPSMPWPGRRCWCRSGSSRADGRGNCPMPR